MSDVLVTICGLVAIWICFGVIAGIWVQGQAMLVPGWRFDHWVVLEQTALTRWYSSSIKLSAKETNAVASSMELWMRKPDRSALTSTELCTVALTCRAGSVSEDKVRQLQRCAEALHRRSLRMSSKEAEGLIPKAIAVRRWKAQACARAFRAWSFGVRYGMSAAWDYTTKHVLALMGKWTFATFLLSLVIWFVSVGESGTTADFWKYVGAGTPLGTVAGVMHGLGQIWYGVTKSISRRLISGWKFVLTLCISATFYVVLKLGFDYLGSPQVQEFMSKQTEEFLEGRSGLVLGALLFVGAIVWQLRIAWSWVRDRRVLASDRIAAGLRFLLLTVMTLLMVVIFMRTLELVSMQFMTQAIWIIVMCFVILGGLGASAIVVFEVLEHLQKVREVDRLGICASVRGYNLKYLLAGVLGFVFPWPLILVIDSYLNLWHAPLLALIIFLGLMLVSFVSLFLVVVQGMLLSVRVKRVAARSRIPANDYLRRDSSQEQEQDQVE